MLEERYDSQVADRVIAAATAEYRKLVPEVTALSNRLLDGALAGTYEYLAYGKALKAEGVAPEDIGGMFADVYDKLVAKAPVWLLEPILRMGTPLLRWKLRRDAESLARQPRREGDWQFEVVDKRTGASTDEDEDARVDFGFDIKSCAVCSLYQRHDASDLVPYLCALDDKMSRTLHLGLRRTGTRALGAERCDFRYQLGGETRALSSSKLHIIDS